MKSFTEASAVLSKATPLICIVSKFRFRDQAERTVSYHGAQFTGKLFLDNCFNSSPLGKEISLTYKIYRLCLTDYSLSGVTFVAYYQWTSLMSKANQSTITLSTNTKYIFQLIAKRSFKQRKWLQLGVASKAFISKEIARIHRTEIKISILVSTRSSLRRWTLLSSWKTFAKILKWWSYWLWSVRGKPFLLLEPWISAGNRKSC